ncbi:MAG: hypothetical protein K0S32_1661, partial [Bacteroidetes bacterium]|nr:hypothetical protein [Bacteroidota bacterium]
DILKFINCNTVSVNEGNAGANQTWNFSNLISSNDTITEWMVLPSTVPNASLYPSSNLVEKYSDGRYVFIDKTTTQNLLVGYSETNLDIKYPDPVLSAQRPVTFGSIFTDTFTSNFVANSYNFSGGGTVTINADAYGTLILPNGTYSNVLRISTTQIQVDTLIQFAITSTTTIKITTWFDANHNSALLKIDSVGSPSFSQKRVHYLLSESAVGIKEGTQQESLRFYPNPASKEISIHADESGACDFYNVAGQKVKTVQLERGVNKITISELESGKYYMLQHEKSKNHIGVLLIYE